MAGDEEQPALRVGTGAKAISLSPGDELDSAACEVAEQPIDGRSRSVLGVPRAGSGEDELGSSRGARRKRVEPVHRLRAQICSVDRGEDELTHRGPEDAKLFKGGRSFFLTGYRDALGVEPVGKLSLRGQEIPARALADERVGQIKARRAGLKRKPGARHGG